MSTTIDKIRHRKSLVVTIAVHAIFIIVCGLGFISCWEQPVPFEVAGEVGVDFGVPAPASAPKNQAQAATEQSEATPDQGIDDPDGDIVDNVKDVPKPSPVKTPTKDPVKNPTKDPYDPTKMTNDKDGKDGKDNKDGKNDGKGSDKGGLGKIDGWKFSAEPTTKEIQSTGTAHITFTINRFGKILNCKATGPFSTEELRIIEDTFKQEARFEKLADNDSNAPNIPGTYDWQFKF